ncbi:hypothetical protein J9317_08490 [Metabacillus sp. KIGAM252]|uniref:Uncharacterized protein n=1 Tax=Metabacillus flavus TaxID=2823519 RepID=A0ABS5LE39_9BACI|nr:hypothetical protein [Metabacillus flavus]MBS2968793.1 hypothetical protein [Metabacillus flavus]
MQEAGIIIEASIVKTKKEPVMEQSIDRLKRLVKTLQSYGVKAELVHISKNSRKLPAPSPFKSLSPLEKGVNVIEGS